MLTLETHTFQQKVSLTAQPLFCLVPFIEAVWWRGPKFDHAFFSRLKPSIFRESICGSVSPQLPLPCPEERERGGLINLPEYASLSFRTAAELALTGCSATTRWTTYITEGTDGLTCAVWLKSQILLVSQPWVDLRLLSMFHFRKHYCKLMISEQKQT